MTRTSVVERNKSLLHEAATPKLCTTRIRGPSDERLFQVCKREGRCLVLLGIDFADILRFPPYEKRGIIVIRPGKSASPPLPVRMILDVLDALTREPIEGRLWIAEPARIRVHEPSGKRDQK